MTDTVDFQVNGWKCSFARFNSADLTRIAGIPAQIQRQSRIRRLLPGPRTGEPVYSTLDAAEIMLRYDLSKLGVPASESAQIGRTGARIVLWFALINLEDVCKVIGSPANTKTFIARFEQDATIADLICGNPEVKRYIFRTPVSQVVFLAELPSIINDVETKSGAFVDLERFAVQLVEGSRRPLVTVNLDTQDNSEIVSHFIGRRVPHLRSV